MRFEESLAVGFQALRVNTIRSLVTALGIIVGVAAVECTISIGAGAEQEIAETIRSLGSNLLVVMPGAQNSHGVRLEAGTRRTLTEQDAVAIRREIPDVQIAAPLISRQVQVVAANKNWATLAAGIDPDYPVAREWRIESGRALDRSDLDSGAKHAVIGADVADHLFGDRWPIGEFIRVGNVRFSVVGMLARKGVGAAGRSQDNVVFVPLSTARNRMVAAVPGEPRDALSLISIKVAESAALPDVKNVVETLLRRRHQLRSDATDDFVIENPADVLDARAGATRTLGLLLLAVASVSLAVGGIGVMNIMLVAIGERTREIGVRMAVGARRRDILQQLLVETVVLTLSGGMVGVLVGVAASLAIAWNAGWRVELSPAGAALACGLAGVVGLFFGLYPAYRASRMDPLVALRQE